MDEMDLERIRAAFWSVTRVDITHLEPDEVRRLLALLPEVIAALNKLYDLETPNVPK